MVSIGREVFSVPAKMISVSEEKRLEYIEGQELAVLQILRGLAVCPKKRSLTPKPGTQHGFSTSLNSIEVSLDSMKFAFLTGLEHEHGQGVSQSSSLAAWLFVLDGQLVEQVFMQMNLPEVDVSLHLFLHAQPDRRETNAVSDGKAAFKQKNYGSIDS